MTFPTVADARRLGKRCDLDGVLIISIDRNRDTYGVTSYGRTRARCKAYGGMAEAVGALIEHGILQVPALEDTPPSGEKP